MSYIRGHLITWVPEGALKKKLGREGQGLSCPLDRDIVGKPGIPTRVSRTEGDAPYCRL